MPASRPASVRGLALWLLLVTSLSCLAGARLRAQQPDLTGRTIKSITIEGLERSSATEILGQLRIRVSDRYDPRLLEEETARIYELGRFEGPPRSYVEEFQDGVAIRFVVREKPLVAAVRFTGNENLTRSDLVDGTPPLRTRDGDLYNEYLVRLDEDTIRDRYVEAGYLFVAVDHEVARRPHGAVVTFRIQEGTWVRVREVRFLGNRSISESELLGFMRTRERHWWTFGLLRSGRFKHEDLETDVLSIKRYYRSHGFLDVRVEPDSIDLDPDKSGLVVTIRIEEGPQYTFRGYRFTGNTVFANRTLEDLTSAPAGKPYNEARVEEDRQAILNYYKDRAYIFCEVERKFIPALESTGVFIRFDIRENNEIHINEVKVRGNRKTRDKVVRRELEFYPGEKIDHSKLLKSRSNLARLGFFSDINYSYEATDSPSSRDLVVDVVEQRTGQINFSIGVQSGLGVIGGVDFQKQNFDLFDWPDSFYDIPDSFTGAGQTLHISARPGTITSSYSLTFIEPYLFDTRNSLRLEAAKRARFFEDWREDRTRVRAEVFHSFDFDRDLGIFLEGRVEDIEIEDIESDAPADAFEFKGHNLLIGTRTGLEYDKRIFEPLEGPFAGHRERFGYEFVGGPLGGDLDFHGFDLLQDLYFTLYTHEPGNYHHIIALRTRYGWRRPFDTGDTVPIFERFYLGGPYDVRGFRFRGLGPHANGEPIGGTAQLWGTLEYSFPLFRKLLRGVVFIDHGNLSDLSDFKFERTRISAGGGVRINLPALVLVGPLIPIGLYFGVPIQKEDEDESRLFLFSIGGRF